MENKESSLTTLSDRDRENKWKPSSGAPPLNNEQTEAAMKELSDTSFVELFPRLERFYADPGYSHQVYCLVSFVPAKGSKPDSDGVYGMFKCRGVFPNLMEAQQRSEWLIRNVDSYHKIYTTFVGRPFPATESSNFSSEVSEVDLKKKMIETMSADIKKKKEEEQKTMKDIKEREQRLLDESKEELLDTTSPDHYTTLRVKYAQLKFTYIKTEEKMKEMKEILIKTRKEFTELDKTHPEYRKGYFDRYRKARDEAGIPEESNSSDNWMQFLGEDTMFPWESVSNETKETMITEVPLRESGEKEVAEEVEIIDMVD